MGLTPSLVLSGNNLGQVVHTRAFEQYNLVPVKGWWCPAAGNGTIGLASHWSQTSLVYPPVGWRPKKGKWTPHVHSSCGMAHFTFTCICAEPLLGSGWVACDVTVAWRCQCPVGQSLLFVCFFALQGYLVVAIYTEHNMFDVYYKSTCNSRRHHLIIIILSSSSSTHNNNNQPWVPFFCPVLCLACCACSSLAWWELYVLV